MSRPRRARRPGWMRRSYIDPHQRAPWEDPPASPARGALYNQCEAAMAAARAIKARTGREPIVCAAYQTIRLVEERS